MKEIDDIIFEESPKTYLEILKVNTREVPFANLLAFFFKPTEKHGLGTLFIQSLLATNNSSLGLAGQNSTENSAIDKPQDQAEKLPSINPDTVEVKVECLVGSNKRIDILIVSDNFVICIEFKINHDLDNPLEEYKKYVEANYKGKQHYFVILTPYKKEPIGNAKKVSGFKQVILSHFLKRVKEELPTYDYDKDNRYYQYFCDLMQTVENRKIRSIRHATLKRLSEKLHKSGIECVLHSKNGGYLEARREKTALKIRIRPSGWQLEEWAPKKLLKTIPIQDKCIGYDGLLEQIKAFHQSIFQDTPREQLCS